MGARRAVVVATLVALVVGGLASPGDAAPAEGRRARTTVTCGQTITESIVLANDLSCPTYPLLKIAPGIRIDLGGHTLANGRGGSCFRSDFRFGGRSTCPLYVPAGATVTNGTLRDTAVVVAGTASRLKMAGTTAILDGGTVEWSRLTDGLVDGGRGTLTRSSLLRTDVWFDNTPSTPTMHITRNVIIDSPGDSHGGQRSARAAISISSETFFPGEITGEIVGNWVVGSGTAGIAYWGNVTSMGALAITDNVVANSAGTGIVVDTSFVAGFPDAGPLTVARNAAINNGGSGITIDTEGLVVVDGGRNIAWRNGSDPQCTGVTCIP